MEFSRCTRARSHYEKNRLTLKNKRSSPGLSKLNSVRKTDVEVDVLLGEPVAGRPSGVTTGPYNGTGAYHRESAVSLERR
jgi:hypothetical protein